MVKALFERLLSVRRWTVQLLSTLLMNSYLTQRVTKALPCPGLNCYACPLASMACPIGSLQHFAAIREVPVYTLGMLGMVGALVGRGACGWLCPFGWLQELLYRVPLPKWRPTWRLHWRGWWTTSGALLYAGVGIGTAVLQPWPGWAYVLYLLAGFLVALGLGWSRYFVLFALVFVVPFFTGEPWFSKLCPQGTLEGAIPVTLFNPEMRALIGPLFWIKIGLLALFLAWMTVTRRPFCRWICPLGSIWSPFNRVSVVRLWVEEEACLHCDRCREVCPMDICVYEDANAPDCIRCLACVRACPVSCIQIETV